MSQGDTQPSSVQPDDAPGSWESDADVELELRISPDDVLGRISGAVADDRLALDEFDRTVSRKTGGRVLAEKYAFRVVEGSAGLNAFSLVCEGKVEPSRQGSVMKVRFHMRSVSPVFLLVWGAFVFLICAYEVIRAWPHAPSWRVLGIAAGVSALVVPLFVLARKHGRMQEVRMRRLLKGMFADATLYVRERPVA